MKKIKIKQELLFLGIAQKFFLWYNNLKLWKKEEIILMFENILPFQRNRSLRSLFLWYNKTKSIFCRTWKG